MDRHPRKKPRLLQEDLSIDDGTTSITPAWADPDDDGLDVSLATEKRRRKLRDTVHENSINGREYESRLRRQFEKVNPAPEWAANARRRLRTDPRERRHASTDSEEKEQEQESEAPLLSETGSVLSRRHTRVIEHGTLSVERLRDANLSAPAEGEIKSVRFHPSPQVSILLAASSDRRLRLYNVRYHSSIPTCAQTSYRSTGIPTPISTLYTFPPSRSPMPPSTLTVPPSFLLYRGRSILPTTSTRDLPCGRPEDYGGPRSAAPIKLPKTAAWKSAPSTQLAPFWPLRAAEGTFTLLTGVQVEDKWRVTSR